jgi:hypothetical protein
MADNSVIALACINASGNGVRVEFRKQGDRFRHTIFRVCGDERSAVLKSVESKSTEVFPASPPWADVHQQDDTLFFTGATTQAHWSMSVQRSSLAVASHGREPCGNRSRGAAALPRENESSFLDFDIACRLKSPPSCIGSVYQCSNDVETVASDLGHYLLTVHGRKESPAVIAGSLASGPKQGCRVAVLPHQSTPHQLQLSPGESAPSSYPATIQWRYGVCLALG